MESGTWRFAGRQASVHSRLGCSALLAAGYLMPVVQMAYFRKDPQEEFREYGDISYSMLIPICVTTIIAVVLGIVPDIYPHFYELATMASNAICAGWNGGWM